MKIKTASILFISSAAYFLTACQSDPSDIHEKDTTKPRVTLVIPVNGKAGVSTSTRVYASFSEAVLAATITTATFLLEDDGSNPVEGTAAYDTANRQGVFLPSSPLSNSTTYTATVTTGVMDRVGNALAQEWVWTFSTGTGPDATPPTVISIDPLDDATGFERNREITAEFDEEMDPDTMNGTTFTVVDGLSAPVAGAVSYNANDREIVFNPSANLAANTTYTAELSTAATDLAGNSLASAYTWSFTTGSTTDTTPPQVTSTNPASGATGVSVSVAIRAMFSESLDPASINDTKVTVKDSLNNDVAGIVTFDEATDTITFTPELPLLPATLHTVTLKATIKDTAGNAMGAAYTWSFTTGGA